MNKYECYIPQDVYDEVITEIQWFYEKFKQEAVDLTIDDKIVNFFYSIGCFLNLDNNSLLEKSESIYKCFVGPNSNLDIIPQETIIKAIFNESMLPFVSNFLDNYDNMYFWKAFGVSMEEGDRIKGLLNTNATKTIFEVLKNSVIDKKIVCESILPHITYLASSSRIEVDDVYFPRLCRHLFNKFPRIVEFVFNDMSVNQSYLSDYSTVIQVITSDDVESLKYNPQLLYDLFRVGYMCQPEYCLFIIHQGLTTNSMPDINKALRMLFPIHKYGYEIYSYYLRYCLENKFDAWTIVESPEIYFVNSYKTPQLKSLCNRYFPLASEEESKKQTIKCFERIFKGLQDKKYIKCTLNEFLWAFGLTDKYPHGFKRIAFQTPKEKKANGAFLTLLKILGYEEDELKEMRMERKNKPNLINQIFDLTLSRKTKESKDYHDLLKIVKSSGLPIKG